MTEVSMNVGVKTPKSSLLPRSNDKVGKNYQYQLFSEHQK